MTLINMPKQKEKKVKIAKDFYKPLKLKYKLKFPTFKCCVCGEEILDRPAHWKFKRIK